MTTLPSDAAVGRRGFIAGAAAAALSVSAPRPAFSAPAARRTRLAFQVYGIRDLCARDFPAALGAANALGYEGVETGRFYGRSARELGALVRDAGLELVALQLYPHALTEPQLRDTIRFCHECGCRRVNTAWFKAGAENENDWQLVVNVLNHAAEVCAGEGIEIGYHNHDQEFRVSFGGKSALAWMYERFSPKVRQEFDPGWCVVAGGDPLKWLAAHPGRNPTVHVMPAIADATGGVSDSPGRYRPGECGVGGRWDRADWKALLPALRDDGVEWLVVKPTAFPGSIADLAASARFVAQCL